jgi:hypothetical protein
VLEERQTWSSVSSRSRTVQCSAGLKVALRELIRLYKRLISSSESLPRSLAWPSKAISGSYSKSFIRMLNGSIRDSFIRVGGANGADGVDECFCQFPKLP